LNFFDEGDLPFLKEYHDEACLAVMNNKYNDGIAWHDVACHTRSVIVCEDSDQLMNLIQSTEGIDVKETVTQNERGITPENIDVHSVKRALILDS